MRVGKLAGPGSVLRLPLVGSLLGWSGAQAPGIPWLAFPRPPHHLANLALGLASDSAGTRDRGRAGLPLEGARPQDWLVLPRVLQTPSGSGLRTAWGQPHTSETSLGREALFGDLGFSNPAQRETARLSEETGAGVSTCFPAASLHLLIPGGSVKADLFPL